MRLLLTGGGTGGHIYPGLTLWNYVQQHHPSAEILYIGTERGLEGDIVSRAGLPFKTIRAAGLKRQLSWQALRTAVETYRGYGQAKRLLRQWRPDVVVGTGGYVTLPVVYAAAALGIPAVIWEANARPGLTNQLCAKKASAVAICFPDSAKWFSGAKTVRMTGNPRASEVLVVEPSRITDAERNFHIDGKRRLIVFFAGSRGAETVNEVLLRMLPKFAHRPDWQLVYVTGEAHYERIHNQAPKELVNVEIVPFIYDMPAVLKRADVAVTRAGGATMAELCALGVPSILIPSPFVTANHQEENARRMADQGAACMLREKELTSDRLWQELSVLLDTEAGLLMREKALQAATPNAAADLYALVMEAIQQKN